MSTPRLITLPISHFCELARWGLELAGVPFEEERHVLGFQTRATRRLRAGRLVPVLAAGGEVVAGSVEVLAWADAHRVDGRPALQVSRARFGELLGRSVDEYGAATRRLFFALLMRTPKALVVQVNAEGAPRWQGRMFQISYPIAMAMGRRMLGADAQGIAAAREQVSGCLDRVAERLADGRPYLDGDALSGADLCFASLSAPLCVPEGCKIPLAPLDGYPAEVREQLDSWRAHPAMAHALRVYARHRAG